MKKILIALVIAALVFFAFFSIETTNQLDFLEQYKTEISFSDYKLHKIISVGSETENLKLTIYDCNITKDNMERYVELGKEIATKTNEKLNQKKEFNEIQVIFKPANLSGIKINDLISINELNYNFSVDEL